MAIFIPIDHHPGRWEPFGMIDFRDESRLHHNGVYEPISAMTHGVDTRDTELLL
jgi:hypothetical protein